MRFSRSFCAIAAALALAGGLAACSSESEPKYVERSVDDLYNTAVNDLEAGKWTDAAHQFEEVERQHPYSVWAIKAQLMAGYAEYEANRYDEAVLAINRFVQLHPGNRDVPYALYLKALCFYEQISDVERDQQMSQEALKALQELVRRFPNSKYARDARLKIDLTRDHLAGKEMEVGRYYLNRGDYLAAINRFRIVVRKYQTTTHVAEALHRLVEAYTALGLKEEARRTAAVLGTNYPGSEWYVNSYDLATKDDMPKGTRRVAKADGEDEPGFFARTMDWLF